MGVGIAWIASGSKLQMTRPQIAMLCLAALGLLTIELYRGIGVISELQYVLSGQASLVRFLTWGLPAACLVLAAVQLERLGVSATRQAWLAPWVFLGDASYSIYLVHPLVQLAIRQYGQVAHLNESAELTVIVAALASCIAGALCYALLEQPLLRAMPERIRWRPIAASVR
jgi:peptidoglycan/LPS O-acetylase OafA/YrhL